MRESSSTAVRVWPSAWVVDSAAVETPVMFVAISVVPPAASCTDRDISPVVAVCSSTAPSAQEWQALQEEVRTEPCRSRPPFRGVSECDRQRWVTDPGEAIRRYCGKGGEKTEERTAPV